MTFGRWKLDPYYRAAAKGFSEVRCYAADASPIAMEIEGLPERINADGA